MRAFYFWLIAATLPLLSDAHAGEPRRCEANGKIIITDLPCSSFGGIDTNPRSKAADAAQTPRATQPKEQSLAPPRRTMQPAPALPTKASQNPSASLLQAFLSSLTKPPLIYFWLLLGTIVAVRILGRPRKSSPLDIPLGGASSKPFEPGLPKTETGEFLPYESSDLMSRYELEFFQILKKSLPECEILPQIPLSAIIKIDRKRAGKHYDEHAFRWRARISQQRLDFLVCTAGDMRIITAVELDDPSHDKAEAQARDRKKDQSLAEAGIPILRWRVENLPTPEEIRDAVLKANPIVAQNAYSLDQRQVKQ